MQAYSLLPPKLDAFPDNLVVALPSMACASVSGDDAKTFLHSQLTIDINKMADATVRRSAHCDFKGKSWSVSLVANGASALYLLAGNTAIDASVKQLKKYGVFSKIEITSETENFDFYLLKGKQANALLEVHFAALPDSPMAMVESDSGFCITLDYPADTVLLALKKDASPAFLQAVSNADFPLFEETAATALDIASGIPALTSEEQINQYVPQMMNLQALDAIDFNKGCYMGQEVVARTRYLGRNKRAAMIFKLPEACDEIATAKLEKQAGEHWRSGGTILRAAVLGEETWILAVVNNDTTPEDSFRLSTNPALELIHCDLPYTL